GEPEGPVGRGDRLAVRPGAVVERDRDAGVIVAEGDVLCEVGRGDAVDGAGRAVICDERFVERADQRRVVRRHLAGGRERHEPVRRGVRRKRVVDLVLRAAAGAGAAVRRTAGEQARGGGEADDGEGDAAPPGRECRSHRGPPDVSATARWVLVEWNNEYGNRTKFIRKWYELSRIS